MKKKLEGVCSMTAKEYKEEIGKIVDDLVDEQFLRQLYIFSTSKQKNPNVTFYRGKIIEMVAGLQNERFLRQIYTIIMKHIEKGGH